MPFYNPNSAFLVSSSMSVSEFVKKKIQKLSSRFTWSNLVEDGRPKKPSYKEKRENKNG